MMRTKRQSRSRRSRAHNFGFAVCLVILAMPGSPSAAQSRLTVSSSGDRVTATVNEHPLADAVLEVARLTGTAVLGLDKLRGRTTADFRDRTAAEAFELLLTNVNYVLAEPSRASTDQKRYVLHILSMKEGAGALALTGPIRVAALEAIVAADAAEEAQDMQDEVLEHPESPATAQEAEIEVAELTAAGAFAREAGVDALREHLQHDNIEVRAAALRTLAAWPARFSVPPLIEALRDEAWRIRNLAVELLADVPGGPVLKLLGDAMASHPDRYVRIGALRILALRAEDESVPYLEALLDEPDPLLREAAGHILHELMQRAKGRHLSQTDRPAERRSPEQGR